MCCSKYITEALLSRTALNAEFKQEAKISQGSQDMPSNPQHKVAQRYVIFAGHIHGFGTSASAFQKSCSALVLLPKHPSTSGSLSCTL